MNDTKQDIRSRLTGPTFAESANFDPVAMRYPPAQDNGQRNRRTDAVNKPAHYTSHPSGIECIQVTEHMGFNVGNAVKYLWRCDLKADAIEDLEKAAWYIKREIEKRKKAAA